MPIPEDLQDLADRAGDRLSPNRGNPFRKAMDFRVDDQVRWFKQDSDIPSGSIGTVVGFKPVRKKKKERGPQVLEMGRVYVAWATGKYFAMEPTELLLYRGTRTVPVGADWRGKMPKKQSSVVDAEEDISADNSDHLQEDETSDKSADHAESEGDSASQLTDSYGDELHEICWHRPIGDCPDHVLGETQVVPVPVDFIVGDLVTWHGGDVPESDIGAVTDFTPQLDAKVIFCSSKDVCTIPQRQLRLHLPSAADDVVAVYKTVTVQHAQLLMEQQQADRDHEELILKLRGLTDKELKTWMQQKYPEAHGDKIDKHNNSDRRHKHEKRKHWKQRVHEMHAEELAGEEKAETDHARAAKIAELARLKERTRVDYEHTVHLSDVGMRTAHIEHAEHMHVSHEKWDKDHKRILHVRTKKEKAAKQQRDEEDYQKVLAAQAQLTHKHLELQKFAAAAGIHDGAEPGGVAGMIDKYKASKVVLVQGFQGKIQTDETIKAKFEGFGEVIKVIEKESSVTNDQMDWALVMFATVEGAQAALVGADIVDWGHEVTVNTRILGNTVTDGNFLFTAMDTDNSGTLSREEFQAALSWLGVPKLQADKMMSAVDANSDGQLDRSEFMRASGLGRTEEINGKAGIEATTQNAPDRKNRKSKTKAAKKAQVSEPDENHNPLFVGQEHGAFEQETTGTQSSSLSFERD